MILYSHTPEENPYISSKVSLPSQYHDILVQSGNIATEQLSHDPSEVGSRSYGCYVHKPKYDFARSYIFRKIHTSLLLHNSQTEGHSYILWSKGCRACR